MHKGEIVKIGLTFLFIASIFGCSNTDSPPSQYIVSEKRNDIKEHDPELWSWIEVKAKGISAKKLEAKNIYPTQLEYAKKVATDDIQIEKGKAFIGTWIDCEYGKGAVYIFRDDGTFQSFDKSFDDSQCKSGVKPGLAGFGFEFMGYYLIGKEINRDEEGTIYELDLIHTDSPRTEKYDESLVYYKVVKINNDSFRLSHRGNPGVILPPTMRNLRLDEERYTYNKSNLEVSAD